MRDCPSDWLVPDWPTPAGVRACSTTRAQGSSSGPYGSLNLADHVGDDPVRVQANRRFLRERLKLPEEPAWLHQVHGTALVRVDARPVRPAADASTTRAGGVACAVLTADCLPVLFCSADGSQVAAAHAGWRGLAAGVLEQAVRAFSAPAGLLAWLGPAIGPQAFVVGAEVRAQFLERDPGMDAAFRSHGDRYLADLYHLARRVLGAAGVTQIYGGSWCTHSDPTRFFSYRRDGVCGRMASLIWIER